MALKFKFKAKEEIPAEHVSLYIPSLRDDGVWLLGVDGAVEKAKFDEFRNTNVALLKERKRGSPIAQSGTGASLPRRGGGKNL